jgi:hypothetical protein
MIRHRLPEKILNSRCRFIGTHLLGMASLRSQNPKRDASPRLRPTKLAFRTSCFKFTFGAEVRAAAQGHLPLDPVPLRRPRARRSHSGVALSNSAVVYSHATARQVGALRRCASRQRALRPEVVPRVSASTETDPEARGALTRVQARDTWETTARAEERRCFLRAPGREVEAGFRGGRLGRSPLQQAHDAANDRDSRASYDEGRERVVAVKRAAPRRRRHRGPGGGAHGGNTGPAGRGASGACAQGRRGCAMSECA